jgi:hypothetical protein
MSPRTPIINPDRYFGRADRPSLKIAVGIVMLDALLTTLFVWWFVQQIFAQIELSASEREIVTSEANGMLPVVFFGVFLGWLLGSAIVHALMWFAGADRGFEATLAVTGEASMVNIVLMPLVVGGTVAVIGRVPSDPNAAVEFMRQVANRQIPILLLVGFVNVLWSGVVQAIGLSEVHDITLGKTLLVVIGLGLLGLLIG